MSLKTRFGGQREIQDADPADLRRRTARADKQDAWVGSIEGMKILRRRFASLLPDAQISVNSGKIDDDRPLGRATHRTAFGEIAGDLRDAVGRSHAKVRGLAIKEIDGRLTHIDVWKGPADGQIDIADDKQLENARDL